MIVQPYDYGIDLLASDLVRSPGLHASTIFGDLFEDLDPKRYEYDGPPNPVSLAMGTAWEKHLEYLLLRNGVDAFRPDEFLTRPLGPSRTRVAYSPDLILANGVLRCGEIKWTSKSAKGLPDDVTNHLHPKYDKYLCVCPEVKLLTSDLKQIHAEDVCVGQSLLGFDEFPSSRSSRHLQHTTVRAVRRVSKPCSRLLLADGSTIDVSNDHQWYGSVGFKEQWISTDQLLQSDQSPVGARRRANGSLLRVVPPVWSTNLSEYERGWMAGIADGEGSLVTTAKRSGCLSLILSQNEGLVLERMQSLLQKDQFGYRIGKVSDKCRSLVISNKLDVFRFLAMIRPLRLLAKFEQLSVLPGLSYTPVQVLDRIDLGEQWVYAIETDRHTYLADGFASHNCQLMLYTYFLREEFGVLVQGWLSLSLMHSPWDPQFRCYNLDFTERELQENYQMCINHAVHKGML